MSARALVLVTGALAAAACGGHERETEPLGAAASAVVGGEVSTASEDFVLFLSRSTEQTFTCGGALVAPNLLLTAKHCVYEYVQNSQTLCDATGEPQIGSTGGYVTGPVPLAELGVYAGADGRKRYLAAEPPAAVAKQIVDDGTPTLCSHDLAYVVLDRPVSTAPVARLRLGKRPEASSLLTLAGWGTIDDRKRTDIRMRRAGIGVQRVGLPVADPDATGSLGPRTFETGPGGCTGDSGSPGFDGETGAVFGVLARALNLDPNDPVSPCHPETVSNVYMTIADFPEPLRDAFAAAGAEPWLEDAAAPGWKRFGDACAADLECEGGACAGGACNVDCGKAGASCPSGYACAASARCEPADAGGAGAPPDAGVEATSPAPEGGGGCATSRVPSRSRIPYVGILCGILVVCARRRRQDPST